ncbi:MAG: efflux transporter outer membrane subunit [Pseudomonadales bacterium]|nr:efflux transporter outer membrane subunit [Pseudomonadales bacterium]
MNKPRYLAGVVALILAGCSFAPAYHAPQTSVPAQFKENGDWAAGKPEDAAPKGAWWQAFGDAQLNQLETSLNASNPTLQAALAHYDAVRDILVQTRASLFPDVFGLGSLSRNRQSVNRPLRGGNEPNIYSSNLLGGGISYELDLWGNVRNQVQAALATTQAQAALLANAQLSLQSQLASDYLSLRGLDREAHVLDEDITAFSVSYRITRDRYLGGIASGLDVSRAQTQLESVKALRDNLTGRRAVLEHAIAVLTGNNPSTFHVAVASGMVPIPKIPVGIPSKLLQRRPDVAAAERSLFAANALIGVAKAAYFPNLTLDAVGGYESTGPGHWLTSPNLFWSLGPSFLVQIFDANAIKAQVAQAKANYVSKTADYRNTVLNAFREVEDQMALLNSEGIEAADSAAATQAAQQTTHLAFIQYREGAVNYLEVMIAQATELQAEQIDIALQTRRMVDTVNLIRSLGGSWQQKDLPSENSLSTQKVVESHT